MLPGPVQRGAEARGGGRQRLLDVLGLAAFAVRGHDQAAGEHVRDPGPVVLPHDVQAQVQPRRGPGGGEDLPVIDVQHVGFHPDGRPAPGELGGVHPVRGHRAPVEQARGGQGEGAGADRRDPGPAVVGGAQGLKQSGGRVALPVGTGRDDHRLRLAELPQPGRAVEAQPLGRTGRPVLDRAELQVIPPGHGKVLAGGLEDLAGDGELEHRHAGGDGDGNPVHGRNLP